MVLKMRLTVVLEFLFNFQNNEVLSKVAEFGIWLVRKQQASKK